MNLVLRRLPGLSDYQATWEAMQQFTRGRKTETPDELWVLQHPPIYTLGQAGKPEHLLQATEIPVLRVDRGGQITYHGPGQLLVYVLVDLRRRGLTVKGMVYRLEQAMLNLMAELGIAAQRKTGAPGIYVQEAKIGALGLRVQQGCTTHGLALNVNLDLSPFAHINPCGYARLPVTRLCDLGVTLPWEQLEALLIRQLQEQLHPGAEAPAAHQPHYPPSEDLKPTP